MWKNNRQVRKMLKKVRFAFVHISEEEKQILKERLEKEGLEASLYLGDGVEPEKEEILVTDCRTGELWAMENHCPCLGIEAKERLHTSYITEHWTWISACYLDRIYRRFYGLPWQIFETERCLVREMTVEDMEGLYGLYEEEITRYVEPLYEDKDKEKAYILDYIKHMYGFFEYGMWLVEDRKNGKIIGRAGISNREVNGVTEPELGYIIGKAYQRKGYGMEVCRGILAYAKEELGMEFLNCFIGEDNRPSLALAEKLGFEKVWEEKINNLFWYRKNL